MARCVLVFLDFLLFVITVNQNLARAADVGDSAFDYGKYHSMDEIYDWVGNIPRLNRAIASPFFVSKSYENRSLTGIRISLESTIRRPSLWIQAGVHGREWIAPATLIYVVKEMLESTNNTKVMGALDRFDWFFLPVVNPDGYQYTWTTDRNWLKTRTNYGQCSGADPNRNWDFQWCVEGGSTNPCNELYCGPQAFSEVEVQGVSSYIKRLGNVKGFVELQCYNQMWTTPWGYTSNQTRDFAQQNKGAAVAVAAIKKVRGTVYQHGERSRLVGQISGTSIDWTYGKLGIKYSYSVQLGDKDHGYLTPTKEIEPSGKETLQALLALAEYMSNH